MNKNLQAHPEQLLQLHRIHQVELEMQIEELQRTHAALQESCDRHMALNNSAPVGLLILTREGLIAEINLTASRLLGLNQQKLLGTCFAAFVAPKDGNSWHLFFSDIMGGNKRQHIELRLRRCDGFEFPARLDCLCVKPGDKDSMLGMMLTDMSERKQEEAFRALADRSPVMIARYDRDCRHIYINTVYSSHTGVTLETVWDKFPGEAWRPLLPYKEYMARLNSVMETGEPDHILLEWYESDSRLISYNMLTVVEYDQEGNTIGVLGIGQDITKLKETERYLEESRAQLSLFTAKREETRVEERKRIAREIHDELGQLLSVLRLNAMTLNLQFGSAVLGMSEKVHKMINIIDHATMIVRNIASRLRPVKLHAGIVSALEWLVREFSQDSGINCQLHILTGNIPLDEERTIMVYRIVQESLTNVLRHSGATRVDISLRRKGDVLELEVSDNGKGFDMTQQIPKSYGIVGMQERALLLGGDLDIVSEPGDGTVLKLRFSLTNTESQQKAQCLKKLDGCIQASPRKQDNPMIRLLVVDDHVLVREGLKQLFEHVDDIQIVGEAVSGEEVLTILRKEIFDLVLLDISIQGDPQGAELISKIRECPNSPPILILSMHNEVSIAKRKLMAGAAGFVTKDSSHEELLAAIRKVASGGRYIIPELAEKIALESSTAVPLTLHELLSARELLILRMLAKGKKNNEIAFELGISNKTVSTHKARLMQKMHIDNDAKLIRYAITHDLTV